MPLRNRLRVPSTEYFAELRPDPVLCRVVAWSAAVLALLGLVACGFLALPAGGRAAAGLAWCGVAAFELQRLRRSTRDCTAFRVMADGTAAVRTNAGNWQSASLTAGSVLLRRCGWLRLRTASGRVVLQPVRGGARNNREWRRLQVIWRAVGALR